MKTWFSVPVGLTMRRMRPCAMGLRRKATSLCPGRIISETKLPRPCRWRASSLRWTRAPIPCVMLDLGDAEPKIGIRQELLPRLVNQLEIRAPASELVVGLERRFVTCVQNWTRKLPQLDSCRHQPAQRLGVSGVVLGHHQDGCFGARRLQRGSIGLRQSLPMLEIDEQCDLSAAFPPARVVVVLGDLVQPELL